MPRITHGLALISPSTTPLGHKHLAECLRGAPALPASPLLHPALGKPGPYGDS